jgi:hypothetical protein
MKKGRKLLFSTCLTVHCGSSARAFRAMSRLNILYICNGCNHSYQSQDERQRHFDSKRDQGEDWHVPAESTNRGRSTGRELRASLVSSLATTKQSNPPSVVEAKRGREENDDDSDGDADDDDDDGVDDDGDDGEDAAADAGDDDDYDVDDKVVKKRKTVISKQSRDVLLAPVDASNDNALEPNAAAPSRPSANEAAGTAQGGQWRVRVRRHARGTQLLSRSMAPLGLPRSTLRRATSCSTAVARKTKKNARRSLGLPLLALPMENAW